MGLQRPKQTILEAGGMKVSNERITKMKKVAMKLAHQMDDEKRIYEENLHPQKVEEIRAYGTYIRDIIFREGYNIDTILMYIEQYKELSLSEYYEWIDSEA